MNGVVPIDKNVDLSSSTDPKTMQKIQHRSIREFMREMKQRRVCRAAVTYVLIMWFNLQIADVLVPMTGLPEWTLQFIVVAGAMGFPAVLLLAWIFQVTPQGIVVDVSDPNSDQPTGGWLDTTVSMFLLLVSLVLTVLLIMNFVAGREIPANNDKVVLVRDMSFYGVSEDMERLAKNLEVEVRHRMLNINGVDLTLTSSEFETSDNRGLAIIASISENEGHFHILVQLVETSTGRYLTSSVIDGEIPALDTPEVFLADIVVARIMSHIDA